MARAAVVRGVRIVAATPHVRDDFPTSSEEMDEALAALRAELAHQRVPLDVRAGGELDLEWLDALGTEEARRFALAGNPHFLLVEFPYSVWPLRLRHTVDELRRAGITPVLAHPERNADVQADPGRLRELVEAGALVQLTTASVDGRLGSGPARASAALIAAELAHVLASDAHGAHMRGFDSAVAIEKIGDPAVAHWLLEAMPAAIVAGAPLPPRPTRAARRRRRGLLARLLQPRVVVDRDEL